MRLCMWVYEHIPYSEILNIRPIGDRIASVTLISRLTNFNTINMTQADINYVHIILNMVNIGKLQIPLRFLRTNLMY
jgi:hypothetical protein